MTEAILQDKVVLITGAGRGIGRSIALAFTETGCKLALCSRTQSHLDKTAKETNAKAFTCDVSDTQALTDTLSNIESELGPIDILINNAGYSSSNPIDRITDEEWDKSISINLAAPWHLMRSVIPSMKKNNYGRIINIASTAGLRGYAYVSAYCAAKHGIVGLTRALAEELNGTGITCNALCPGFVDTDMTRRSAENIAAKTGITVEKAVESMASMNKSGKLISPDSIAAEVIKLSLGNANGELIEIE